MELNNNLNNIQIRTGTKIITGTGLRYLVLFTLSDLQKMFNVNDPSVTKYVIYAYNGDDSALGQIDNGVAFTKGSSSWLIWFSQAIPSGKNVRINYLILFNPNS